MAPFGGLDWLALTPEPRLELELPICDPHDRFGEFRAERLPYQCFLRRELAANTVGQFGAEWTGLGHRLDGNGRSCG